MSDSTEFRGDSLSSPVNGLVLLFLFSAEDLYWISGGGISIALVVVSVLVLGWGGLLQSWCSG